MRICNKAHSNSWDQAGFVRFYAMFLDEKVELHQEGVVILGMVEAIQSSSLAHCLF